MVDEKRHETLVSMFCRPRGRRRRPSRHCTSSEATSSSPSPGTRSGRRCAADWPPCSCELGVKPGDRVSRSPKTATSGSCSTWRFTWPAASTWPCTARSPDRRSPFRSSIAAPSWSSFPGPEQAQKLAAVGRSDLPADIQYVSFDACARNHRAIVTLSGRSAEMTPSERGRRPGEFKQAVAEGPSPTTWRRSSTPPARPASPRA